MSQIPSYDELPAGPNGGRLGWHVFGDDDQLGLINLPTEERVAEAATLVKRGVAFPLKERAALQIMLEELLDRVRDDRVVPSPIQRDRIGQDIVNVHVLRLMNLRTVSRLAAGTDLGPWASVIKLTWEETAQHLADTVFETTGPVDPDDEASRGAAMLRYRMASIAGGTTQVQRNILGERQLGLPREPRRG